MTVFVKDGNLEICSRRLLLFFNPESTYFKIANELDLISKLESAGEKYAIQGELAGEGINKNVLKLHGQKLFVFNVYNFLAGIFLPWQQVRELCSAWGLETVPEVEKSLFLPKTVEEIVRLATTKSVINPE